LNPGPLALAVSIHFSLKPVTRVFKTTELCNTSNLIKGMYVFIPTLFLYILAAAYGLLQKKSRLFSISGNNAFLEFFLEGSPEIVQTQSDSRKVCCCHERAIVIYIGRDMCTYMECFLA